MNVLGKLLGKESPFEQLTEHLEKVMACVDLVHPILEAALEGNAAEVKRIAQEIFLLEHEADVVKNRIRDHLPRDLMLPVSRMDYLAFLRAQDGVADNVEDLAMMLTVRQLRLPCGEADGTCRDQLLFLANHAVKASRSVAAMTRRIDELKRAAFTGPVADELRAAADEVSRQEFECDKHQFKLVKAILAEEDPEWPFASSYTLMEVIRALGKMANHAESMSDYLRLMIAD
ncbi:MAG TPA: TIGR00153 family protein [Bacteroidetes bacterium]|nr:TIGR00153 family protein [Bacteroidota bacterium]